MKHAVKVLIIGNIPDIWRRIRPIDDGAISAWARLSVLTKSPAIDFSSCNLSPSISANPVVSTVCGFSLCYLAVSCWSQFGTLFLYLSQFWSQFFTPPLAPQHNTSRFRTSKHYGYPPPTVPLAVALPQSPPSTFLWSFGASLFSVPPPKKGSVLA